LEDFRRLELVRDGRTQTIRSRWRQDKGHRGEWTAFAESVRHEQGAPISFDDLVCSTLATLRIQDSLATGKRLPVDTAAFIDAALQTPSLDE
jgi:hypothetical protein